MMPEVGHRDRDRLLQDLLALRVVDGGERLRERCVHLRVRVPPAVRGAEALVAVVGREQCLERRRGLAGVGAPADEHQAELEPVRAREVHRRGHRHDGGRDADALEHAGDRLRDLLVVHVAVVRPVQREAEPVGPAGLREQLAGGLGVVGVGLERVRCSRTCLRHSWPVGSAAPSITRSAIACAVDRHRQRLAHPRVLERVAVERLAGLVGDERRLVAVESRCR